MTPSIAFVTGVYLTGCLFCYFTVKEDFDFALGPESHKVFAAVAVAILWPVGAVIFLYHVVKEIVFGR